MIGIFDKITNYFWTLTSPVSVKTRKKIEKYKREAATYYGIREDIRIRYKRMYDNTYARAVITYANLDRYIDINVELISTFTDDWLEVLIWHEVAHHKEFDFRGELDDSHGSMGCGLL